MEPNQSGIDIHNIRTDYVKAGLLEDQVKKDAIEQFLNWFNEALKSKVMEPNAMTIATVSNEGQPNARIVLLKGVDENGFVFFTNYNSKKGQEISENNKIALLFFWPELERQVRVLGEVEKTSIQESETYFHSRPIGSQLGAWASQQSSKIDNRGIIEESLKLVKEKYDSKEIPLPDYWGGYRVIPQQIEFWQGRANRLHDRIVYKKTETSWELHRIAP